MSFHTVHFAIYNKRYRAENHTRRLSK